MQRTTITPIVKAPPADGQGYKSKSYEPQNFESTVYSFWEKNGCFEASDENAPGQKSFSIVIPPPNVTGVLHMGHALTNTIQVITPVPPNGLSLPTDWLPASACVLMPDSTALWA